MWRNAELVGIPLMSLSYHVVKRFLFCFVAINVFPCLSIPNNSINLSRPISTDSDVSISHLFSVSIENEEFEIVPLTPEKVLELIEQAYPNPITPDDLAR